MDLSIIKIKLQVVYQYLLKHNEGKELHVCLIDKYHEVIDNITDSNYYSSYDLVPGFLDRLKSYEPDDKEQERIVFSANFHVSGGYTGGNCWGDESYPFSNPPNNDMLQPVELRLLPYVTIKDTQYEYYGNRNDYTGFGFYLDDLYKWILSNQKTVHLFIGLPGSGKTYQANKLKDSFNEGEAIVLDDVSNNTDLLNVKYNQQHIILTDPNFCTMSSDILKQKIEKYFPNCIVKFYWIKCSVEDCLINIKNRCKIDGRFVTKNYVNQLNQKYAPPSCSDACNTVIYGTVYNISQVANENLNKF